MGEVYSHLSEEERQVIQIEVGNGASIRGIGAMLGRSPSSISREIKRNTGLRVKMCVWLGVSRGLDLAFLNAD